jgi:hypothetical protein
MEALKKSANRVLQAARRRSRNRHAQKPKDRIEPISTNARGGNRTHTPLRERDFKSLASTISPPRPQTARERP